MSHVTSTCMPEKCPLDSPGPTGAYASEEQQLYKLSMNHSFRHHWLVPPQYCILDFSALVPSPWHPNHCSSIPRSPRTPADVIPDAGCFTGSVYNPLLRLFQNKLPAIICLYDIISHPLGFHGSDHQNHGGYKTIQKEKTSQLIHKF